MVRSCSALAVAALLAAGITAAADGGDGRISVVLSAYLLTLALAATAVAFRFVRGPDRTPPGEDDVIVGPADRQVVYIRESRGGSLPVATKRAMTFR